MQLTKQPGMTMAGIGTAGLLVAAPALTALAQTAPILAIAPAGTNHVSVTITNNIGAATYDLEWIGALGSPNYSWTFAAIGIPGGTNFLLNVDAYPTTFFRAVLDTNAIPLWEAANPANPGSGLLQVTILSPTNGAVLQ